MDISILLIFLFFALLIYYIYVNKNHIIGYQTIKDYNSIDYNMTKLNNKYKRKSCDDYCSKELCNNFNIDIDNYKKCLNCQGKFKCHNQNTDKCEYCLSFGFNQCTKPINPKNNMCA